MTINLDSSRQDMPPSSQTSPTLEQQQERITQAAKLREELTPVIGAEATEQAVISMLSQVNQPQFPTEYHAA